MWSLSLLSSLKAKFCALVKLGLGGWEDLRTLLTSALSPSASYWLSLVQAASMAVIYSKLGGCLGVTTKLGPLARIDLWAGVKGLLERLMTHLGLGSSWEEPWGATRGWRGGGVFLGGAPVLLGRLGGPVPGGMPMALPDRASKIVRLTCLGITASFPRRKESSGLGGIATFPSRKDSIWLWVVASFPRRKGSIGLRGVATFRGKVSACMESVASFPSKKESSGLGRTASFQGKVSSCQERIATFPRRKMSCGQMRVRVSTCLTVITGLPICLGN